MKIELNKELLTEMGKGAGKVGKSIIVEGTKAVMLKSATAVITQSFEGGLGSVKDLQVDDLLEGGKNKKKKPKKALFKFKKKEDETGDTQSEVIIETVDLEADNAEPIKKNTK